MKIFCISPLLKSRYLYLSLIFSAASKLSFMYIGGVSDSDNILIDSPLSSTIPVGIFAFGDSLLITSPVTAIQYSGLTLSAFSKASLFISSPKTTCKIPVLSLKSRNSNPPRFLFL
ncbi:hypothetical protein D3C73_1038350 [compost metagenome]